MSTVVFACLKCRKQVHNFEELSASQQLCKSCRQKYPITSCKFCRTDFHELQSTDRDPQCTRCEDYCQRYGQPKVCRYCSLPSAFKGPVCHRCQASEKKYGTPVECDTCKVKGAFHKPDLSRQKVGFKTLCYVCTKAYKRALYRSSKHEQTTKVNDLKKAYESASRESHRPRARSSSAGSATSSTVTASMVTAPPPPAPVVVDLSPPSVPQKRSFSSSSSSNFPPPPKKRKLENGASYSVPKRRSSSEVARRSFTPPPPPPMESPDVFFPPNPPVLSNQSLPMNWLSEPNNVSMITFMSEKVATLEKQVKERDQMLLEKDKKITELRASERDTERLLRGKMIAVQKQLENAQMETFSMKKQVAQLTKGNKDKEKELERQQERLRDLEKDRDRERERARELDRERQQEWEKHQEKEREWEQERQRLERESSQTKGGELNDEQGSNIGDALSESDES